MLVKPNTISETPVIPISESTPAHLVGFSESEIIFIKLAAQINKREALLSIDNLKIVK
jgi:hypothetical protein